MKAKRASDAMVRNLRGLGLEVRESHDLDYGYQIQVDDHRRDPLKGRGMCLYQGPSGERFDAWAHGYCVGRGVL